MDPNIMHLEILKVLDAGELENERVVLKATRDCNISWYILFDNTYESDGTSSNLWRHLYIFPDLNIKEGDFIWLYTKKGQNKHRINRSNTITYELHWGLGNTIWNNGNPNDVAHLIKYVDSQSIKV